MQDDFMMCHSLIENRYERNVEIESRNSSAHRLIVAILKSRNGCTVTVAEKYCISLLR